MKIVKIFNPKRIRGTICAWGFIQIILIGTEDYIYSEDITRNLFPFKDEISINLVLVFQVLPGDEQKVLLLVMAQTNGI